MCSSRWRLLYFRTCINSSIMFFTLVIDLKINVEHLCELFSPRFPYESALLFLAFAGKPHAECENNYCASRKRCSEMFCGNVIIAWVNVTWVKIPFSRCLKRARNKEVRSDFSSSTLDNTSIYMLNSCEDENGSLNEKCKQNNNHPHLSSFIFHCACFKSEMRCEQPYIFIMCVC